MIPLQGINSGVDETQDQIRDLEAKEAKTHPIRTGIKKRERKNPRNEEGIRSLWNNFKSTNIHIMGVSQEESEPGIQKLCEKIMTENFPNQVKEIDIKVQEAQRVPNKMNPKRPTPKDIIIKIPHHN